MQEWDKQQALNATRDNGMEGSCGRVQIHAPSNSTPGSHTKAPVKIFTIIAIIDPTF